MRRPDDLRPRGSAGGRLRSEGRISLARALSKFGVCSRREAERWIAAGRVTVGGRTERGSARRIDPRRDRVHVDGRRVGDDAERIVIAFHKPRGLVTTRTDPAGRPTVYDALGAVGRWVFPVGRLDRDSAGLLVLTNDHRLGQRLTDPDHHVPRTYHVRVAGVPGGAALRAIAEGLPLDGALTRPARVRVLGTARGAPAVERRRHGPPAAPRPGGTWLEIVLTEGRNRQVRRMCAAIGHDVLDLVRVRIGRLDLGTLAPGEWRELGWEEVARLSAEAVARGGRPLSSRRTSRHA